MGGVTSEPAASAPAMMERFPIAAISAAVPAVLFGVAALSVPLAAAESFNLTEGQTTALIMALFGIPGIIGVVLTALYRQPMLVAWHTGGIVFVTALATEFSYPEVLGAMVTSGLVVVLIGALGLSARMAALIPAPIVAGIVAGSVMPFVVRVFSDMTLYPLLIGATVGAYVLGRRFLPARIPPILLSLVVGGITAVLTGEITRLPDQWSFPVPTMTLPAVSWQAIISITPVVFIFIAVQSNLTSMVYLRSERYQPPARLVDALTGGGTMVGAFLGIAPISSGSSAIPLVAGPDAGDWRTRHWSIYVCSAAWLLVAAGASIAATLPDVVPLSLLYALAGIALFGVLTRALGEITRGPLRVGPLFAFVVASSNLTILGLGPLFWALAIGMAVTLLLEAEGYSQLRVAT